MLKKLFLVWFLLCIFGFLLGAFCSAQTVIPASITGDGFLVSHEENGDTKAFSVTFGDAEEYSAIICAGFIRYEYKPVLTIITTAPQKRVTVFFRNALGILRTVVIENFESIDIITLK